MLYVCSVVPLHLCTSVLILRPIRSRSAWVQEKCMVNAWRGNEGVLNVLVSKIRYLLTAYVSLMSQYLLIVLYPSAGEQIGNGEERKHHILLQRAPSCSIQPLSLGRDICCPHWFQHRYMHVHVYVYKCLRTCTVNCIINYVFYLGIALEHVKDLITKLAISRAMYRVDILHGGRHERCHWRPEGCSERAVMLCIACV